MYNSIVFILFPYSQCTINEKTTPIYDIMGAISIAQSNDSDHFLSLFLPRLDWHHSTPYWRLKTMTTGAYAETYAQTYLMAVECEMDGGQITPDYTQTDAGKI